MKEEDYVIKPWGSYVVISENDGWLMKMLLVEPKQKISYQRHQYRDEVWTVMRGEGTLILDGKSTKLVKDQKALIPKMAKHRLIAGEKGIEIKEVWNGDDLREDDIERFEDDYNRI